MSLVCDHQGCRAEAEHFDLCMGGREDVRLCGQCWANWNMATMTGTRFPLKGTEEQEGMKATFENTKELRRALSILESTLSRKRTEIPLWKQIAASAEGEALTFQTYGSDLLSYTVPAKITEPGECSLPGRELVQLIRHAGGEVEIERTGEEQVALRSGSVAYQLREPTSNRWTSLPTDPPTVEFDFPFDDLRLALGDVLFATSRDIHRVVLTGVLWRLTPGGLTLVATDTHRLAIRDCTVAHGYNEALDINIPAEMLYRVCRATPPDDNLTHIRLWADTLQASFIVGQMTFWVRCFEDKYPSYEQVIPEWTPAESDPNPKFEGEMEFDSGDVTRALHRLAVIASQNANRVVFSTDSGNCLAQLGAEASDVGKAEEVIGCTPVCGDDMEIAFNYTYLLDWLSRTPNQGVNLQHCGHLGAALWTCDRAGYRYLLMPMQIM